MNEAQCTLERDFITDNEDEGSDKYSIDDISIAEDTIERIYRLMTALDQPLPHIQPHAFNVVKLHWPLKRCIVLIRPCKIKIFQYESGLMIVRKYRDVEKAIEYLCRLFHV